MNKQGTILLDQSLNSFVEIDLSKEEEELEKLKEEQKKYFGHC